MNPLPETLRRSLTLSMLLALVSTTAQAQWGIAYHQSSIPFAGISYEALQRVRPEVRVSTDTFFEEVSLEGVVVYDILHKREYELYAGAGIKTNEFSGWVIPVGANLYPLNTKTFGFHIELSPILGEDYDILRGSFGIRYRFLRQAQASLQ